MKNLLVIFEGNDWRNYGSLAILRPVYCLRTGMRTLWQSVKHSFSGYDMHFLCRPELANISQRETSALANQIDIAKSQLAYQRIILIDATVILDQSFVEELQQVEESQCIVCAGRAIATVLVGQDIARFGAIAKSYIESLVNQFDNSCGILNNVDEEKIIKIDRAVKRYEFAWDLMLANQGNIGRDFDDALSELEGMREHNLADRLEASHIIGASDIFIHPTVTVMPGVVFDASSGPIYIDEETIIEAGTFIVGPFYAGPHCKLLGGKVAGSSLGPVCQIAGELEESILHGFVNKHHAGFIGHSYVGEWVNFGAMTTNSDLKNNYSSVRVSIDDKTLDSGSNKVGAFIGDHTKFGIGTLLNTGINIGIFCNIFGGALVAEKSIASFSWGDGKTWQRYEIDKALETAKRAMARRDRSLSGDELKLIRSLWKSNK